MDLLERHFPSHFPSNPNEATFSDGLGMMGIFDIVTTPSEDGSTTINYCFQNPRNVPQDILVAYEPTIPLMPPSKDYIPGMTMSITDTLTKVAFPNVCPQFANFCKDYSSLVFGSMKDQKVFKEIMTRKTQKAIMSSLEDVIFLGLPQDLVMEEIHHELEFQGIERHTNQLFRGGCLSYIPVNTNSVAGVLLYPSGAAMDILTVLTFSPVLDDSHIRLNPKPENKIKRFQLSGAIRQIESITYSKNGQSYAVVRTDYLCILVRVSVMGHTTNVVIVDKKITQHRITSVALSPFLSKEYIYATEKKKIILSDSRGVLHSWKHFPGTNSKLNQLFCHFGAHPREAFVHDQRQAVIYDFRSPPNTSKMIFQLPHPCMPTDQIFCVARQHPTNHFYHYLVTQDALMVLDQRFPQHAILQTYHNVKGMPSYLEISSYDITEDNSSIVMVGNHIEKQVHCYIVKDKTDSVPVLHSLPWKISPFYEWIEAIDGVRKCGNPKIWERLEEPLMGLAACQVSLENKSSWNVFQISGAGDLFYQRFIPPDPEADGNDQVKSKKSRHQCKLWLKAASAHTGGRKYLLYDSDDEIYFAQKSRHSSITSDKGVESACQSTCKNGTGSRCRKRSRLEYHSECSRCSNVECLFGIREKHGLKYSASKFRKQVVTLDPKVVSARKQELFDLWKPLVCEECCADCVEDVESYGNIRVKMKGFLKSLKLPWQDDLEQVKTFEKRKQESLENELMSQNITPAKQSSSQNASSSNLVQLDMDGPNTSLVVSDELSQVPLSQDSQLTLFSQESNDYMDEIESSFSYDWKQTSATKKRKKASQSNSLGF